MCDKCNDMQKFQNETKQHQDLIRGHIDEETGSLNNDFVRPSMKNN